MAENEQAQRTATSLASDFVGAPEDQFWDLQKQSFHCRFDDFIDNTSIPSGSTKIASAWSLPLGDDYQTVVVSPGLGMMVSGSKDEPYSHNGAETNCIPAAVRFVCGQCGKSFKSQKDVDRHRSSIHDKSTPYFCREPGCHRPGRGFTRKDNYEKHLRDVHREVKKIPNRVNVSQVGLVNETREEENLEGCTRVSLIEMLIEEQEKCALETRKRQEVEQELKIQRQRYEQREDMWLKILLSKEAK